MHGLLGFVTSMLLVFRTNTVCDRWWEARKLWGALTNNSRNFAMKLEAILPSFEKVQKEFFKKIISAFAQALHIHLHREKTRLALLMYRHVNDLHKQAVIYQSRVVVIYRYMWCMRTH